MSCLAGDRPAGHYADPVTQVDGRTLPPELAAVKHIVFDYADGAGVDFEPYDDFLSAPETTGWFRAWTGNPEVDGAALRVFGQDGTGGYAALWLSRAGSLSEQPIVFLGSEGELGLVARNLADFLWLLADGFGPYEAVACPDRDPRPAADLVTIAGRHAPTARRPARQIIADAWDESQIFGRLIASLCH